MGLAIAGVIYLAVTMVASMAVPTDTLAESSGPLLEVNQGPLAINEKMFAAIGLLGALRASRRGRNSRRCGLVRVRISASKEPHSPSSKLVRVMTSTAESPRATRGEAGEPNA